MIKNIIKTFVALLFITFKGMAQENNDVSVFGAMKQELNRNMAKLDLPGKPRPFFMQYYYVEGHYASYTANEGSIIRQYVTPKKSTIDVDVLIGNYARTNVSSYNINRLTQGRATTINHDYKQLRRDYWLLTDAFYKKAIQEYSNNAIKNDSEVSEDSTMGGLIKMKPVIRISKVSVPELESEKLIQLGRKLSAVFLNYKMITRSEVTISDMANKLYVVNSEGSMFSIPNSMIKVEVKAQVQAKDGQLLDNNFNFTAKDLASLGSMDQVKQKVENFAVQMAALKDSKAVRSSYSGPVLFVGEAANDLFIHEFFDKKGLIAFSGKEQTWANSEQDKMGSKIMANQFSITARPLMATYQGEKLAGSFDLDADGITPVNNLKLVENGMLRRVIGTRMPSKFYTIPTGNNRSGAGSGQVQLIVTPGVVEVSTSKGTEESKLKTMLLKAAKESGSEYGYIIKKLTVTRIFVLRYFAPVIYKISVKDGSEEMVHGAELTDFRNGLLKQILGASNRQLVVNTSESNVPVTYITPNAVLIPDLEVNPQQNAEKAAVPIVSAPVN